MLVMAMWCVQAVDWRISVDEKVKWEKDTTWKEAELMVEMVPPVVPTAGKEKTWSVWRGRKDFILLSERESSFDSCKSVMCGFVVISSESMSEHLSLSPSPRTFQEQIRKASLLIEIDQAPTDNNVVHLAYSHSGYR